MQLSDAIKVAERVVADAEAQGFKNTAEAMRVVLSDMRQLERAAKATVRLPIKYQSARTNLFTAG